MERRRIRHPRTTVLHVTLKGVNLGSIDGLKLSSVDLRQDVPLTIVQQSATELVAAADVPVPLQSTDVRLATRQGEFTYDALPPDPVAILDGPIEAVYADPDTGVNPKDFAFINVPTPVNGEWQNLFPSLPTCLRHRTLGSLV